LNREQAETLAERIKKEMPAVATEIAENRMRRGGRAYVLHLLLTTEYLKARVFDAEEWESYKQAWSVFE
jgi:hypothetical protein